MEMQMKTPLRFHLPPVRMTIIKIIYSKCGQDVEMKTAGGRGRG